MNDLIGAPVPVLIDNRIFHFSPLSDFEFALLDGWVHFHIERRLERYSDEWFDVLATDVGITQLLIQSVRRTKPMSVEDAASFLNSDERRLEVFAQWVKLNFQDVEYPELKELPPTSKETSETKKGGDPRYDALLKHGFTYQQIADMTPFQQYMAVEAIVEVPEMPTFNTMGEYYEWRRKHFKK